MRNTTDTPLLVVQAQVTTSRSLLTLLRTGTDLVANDLDTVTLFEAVDIALTETAGIASEMMIATGKSMTYTASVRLPVQLLWMFLRLLTQQVRSRLHSVVLARTSSRWVVVLTRTPTITVVLVRRCADCCSDCW